MGDMNFSLTTFNKTGKLMQIEYALARVGQGKMSLGIKGIKVLEMPDSKCFVTFVFNFSQERCCHRDR